MGEGLQLMIVTCSFSVLVLHKTLPVVIYAIETNVMEGGEI